MRQHPIAAEVVRVKTRQNTQPINPQPTVLSQRESI